MNMKILVIHGPNTPLIGKITAGTDKRLTLDKIDKSLRSRSKELELEIKILQYYNESKIVKIISQNRNSVNGILINPTSLSLTCYSIREIISITKIPTVEVILKEFPFSNEYYKKSVLKEVVSDRIYDSGIYAYIKGLNSIYKIIISKK